jgi:pSer/pThr/pTyr-binding forkhead associated (FHA) protein
MVAQITLTATTGGLTGEQFILPCQAHCLVGRSRHCLLQLPLHDLLASRQHCLLAVDAPCIGVVDLGSLNGTFVNGQRIGQRQLTEFLKDEPSVHWLVDGDELKVGQTIFRVQVSENASDTEVLSEQTEGLRHAREARLAA